MMQISYRQGLVGTFPVGRRKSSPGEDSQEAPHVKKPRSRKLGELEKQNGSYAIERHIKEER